MRRALTEGSNYTYYRVTTVFSGHPVSVVRHYHGPDDNRFDVWRNGQWEMANHYANIVMLGEDADEISEEEALALMHRLDPKVRKDRPFQ